MIEWKIIDSKTQKSSNTGSRIAKKGRKKGGTEGRRARRAGRAAEPTFEILPTRFAELEGLHLSCSSRGNKILFERFLRHKIMMQNERVV